MPHPGKWPRPLLVATALVVLTLGRPAPVDALSTTTDPFDDKPVALAVNASTNLAYVANSDSNTGSVISP